MSVAVSFPKQGLGFPTANPRQTESRWLKLSLHEQVPSKTDRDFATAAGSSDSLQNDGDYNCS